MKRLLLLWKTARCDLRVPWFESCRAGQSAQRLVLILTQVIQSLDSRRQPLPNFACFLFDRSRTSRDTRALTLHRTF